MALLDVPVEVVPQRGRDSRISAAGRAQGVVALAVGIGLLQRGGFFQPTGLEMAGLLMVAAGLARGLAPTHGTRAAQLSGLALLGCWAASAATDGIPRLALPFGVALLCLVLALQVGPRLALVPEQLADVAAAVGSAYALVGFIGVSLRIEPLALRSQGLWRMAGTLTYANASGALLAMALVLALGRQRSDLAHRITVFLISAGLVTTMCRSALLALLVTLPILGLSAYRRHLGPLLLGAAVGVPYLVTASHPTPQPLLLGALLVGAVLASVGGRRIALGALAAGAVALALNARTLQTLLHRRLGRAHVDDRLPEWRAGWRMFLDHPWRGAGAERHLFLPSGELARFVHNEPLQVLMSTGVIGGVLLAWLVRELVRLLRLVERQQRAAVIVLAVCALFDFAAHIPVLMTTVGLLATTRESSCRHNPVPAATSQEEET